MFPRGLARRFRVLAYRDFRLLLADRLLAPASFAFSLVGVSFAVLDVTGSTADLSYVLAAQIFPSLVFALVGGVVADRVPPQRVIVAANLMIALGEGSFAILVLTGHPPVWQMAGLEVITGAGMAMFYPASAALLPRLVPGDLVHEASALSRLVMNTAQMSGAAAAGLVVAATGPGWALLICAVGTCGTVPLLLSIRATGVVRTATGSLLRELRDGWSEFASRTWVWVIVAQYCVVLAAWYGGVQVLGPVIARRYLGGPAAWGAITSAEAVGLVAGGLLALRYSPRRPMVFVTLIGGCALALTPLVLAVRSPLVVICAAALVVGATMEITMVLWTVALTRLIPPASLARVSSYDFIGSTMAVPFGVLVMGPIAATFGTLPTEFGAAVVIAVTSVLAVLPRAVRRMATIADEPPAPGQAEMAAAGTRN